MNNPTIHKNDLAMWRILVFMGVVIASFVIYLIRLFGYQVIEYPEWLAAADEQRTSTINIAAPRGIIYDRNSVILAHNIPSYNIVVVPARLPDDPGDTQRIFRELSELIDYPVNQGVVDSKIDPYVPCKSDHGIAQIAEYGRTLYPYRASQIKCNVDSLTARIVLEKSGDWPGIEVEILPVRDYPTGLYTANIIGFLGPIYPEVEQRFRELGFDPSRDLIGFAGIEDQFQDLLGGRNGLRTVEVDVGGRVLRDLAEPIDPVPGYNIRLTIDYRLQEAAYSILTDEIESWNRAIAPVNPDKVLTSGVVIAINPNTGEILAMVSYPTYQNNRMARFIPAEYYEELAAEPRSPLMNHAISDELPVGSVFKIVTGVGALNEGVVTPDQIIETPGLIRLEQKYYSNEQGRYRDYVDWINRDGTHPEGLGRLDFVHGLAYSSNVYFYKLGGGYGDEVPDGGLGICRLGTYARALGYGLTPGIELPAVANGLIPDPTWKRLNQGESWTTGDTYITSVGQGLVTASPLQVLLSAATVATGGKLWEPTIVREILDSEGNVVRPFEPHLRWDLTISPTIQTFEAGSIRDCEPTGELKTIEPWVFDTVRQGMHLATTIGTLGELAGRSNPFKDFSIPAGGKTGTAEYCDKYVDAKGLCIPGNWPSHAWTVAFAPYDSPEIAVVAFVYNGNEGAPVAGPIARRMLQTYFALKAVDAEQARP